MPMEPWVAQLCGSCSALSWGLLVHVIAYRVWSFSRWNALTTVRIGIAYWRMSPLGPKHKEGELRPVLNPQFYLPMGAVLWLLSINPLSITYDLPRVELFQLLKIVHEPSAFQASVGAGRGVLPRKSWIQWCLWASSTPMTLYLVCLASNNSNVRDAARRVPA